MDPLDTKKIDRILALTEENNALLSKMRKSQKNAQMLKGLYWALIIILTIGGYFALKPLLGNLGSAYGISNASDIGASVKNLNSEQVQDLLKSLK